MNRLLKTMTSGAVSLLLVAVLAVPAWAADFDFSVSPVLPANQREGTVGYFDLLVTPGQQQDLIVTVDNPTDEEIVVTVEAITASTNRNGIINYTTPGVYDEQTMQHLMADIMKPNEPTVTVPPQSSKDFTVHLTVPQERFDGILLGSIFVLKGVTQAERDTGKSILNQYSYVIAVRIAENLDPIGVDFALGDVVAGLDNAKATIITNIRNPQPQLVKKVSVTSRIYPLGSNEAIMEKTNDQVDFAPNSVFEFSLKDEAGYGVQPGMYLAKVDVEHEGRTWNFEQEFEIKAEEANNINQNALNQTQQRPLGNLTKNMPTWVVVVISVALLLLLVLLVILVMVWWNNRSYKKYCEELKNRSSQSDSHNSPEE